MDRGTITKAYQEAFNTNKEVDLLDLIADGYYSDNYSIFLKDEEVYIIDWNNNRLINWYKLGHIGRCLRTVGQEISMEEMIQLFKDIVKEYKESQNN